MHKVNNRLIVNAQRNTGFDARACDGLASSHANGALDGRNFGGNALAFECSSPGQSGGGIPGTVVRAVETLYTKQYWNYRENMRFYSRLWRSARQRHQAAVHWAEREMIAFQMAGYLEDAKMMRDESNGCLLEVERYL
jgi:hypothetical protein